MRIFPPELEIGEREGFNPTKDIFERVEFGEGIANLFGSASDPLIAVLDAPWGMGKTTFIKMLAGHLRKEGFPVVYFDAFKNDHVDNGFLTIAGEIVRLSQELKKDKSAKHKAFVRKAARAGAVFLRMGTKIGVKAATLGAIDATDFEGLRSIADDIAKETSTKADEYVESLLRLQSQEHETLEQVRQALSQLAASFSDTKSEKRKARPLVFIIDELDRCRPTFALELLEKIKHIFSITNVHFLLSTHLSQLESTVRFSYGSEIDARVYLQKFYNLILHFPEHAPSSPGIIAKYCNYLSDTLSLNQNDLKLVRYIAEAKQLPLRTIERIVTCIAVARFFTPKNFLWLDPIISGLSVMKILDPDCFNRAIRGRLTLDEATNFFSFDSWPPGAGGAFASEWWTFCLAKRVEDHPGLNWRAFQQGLFQYNIDDREAIIRIMASHINRLRLPSGG